MKVTEKAQRPARMDGKCFYCDQPIGDDHVWNCVLIKRKITIRMTVEYKVSAPAHWGPDKVEQHRNCGTWCADNALKELPTCLCGIAQFKVIKMEKKSFLEE